MRRLRRLHLLLLAPAVLLAAWEAVALFLVIAGAEPGARPVLMRALSGQAPALALWWLAAAGAAAFGLYRLHQALIIGPARLADAARVLAEDPNAPPIPMPDAAALRGVAGAINALAQKNAALRLETDRLVEAATAAAAYQRDQLAALMAEMEQGVIVCNPDGNILFYNQRASALLSPLFPAAHAVGLGRSIETLLDPALVAHAREVLDTGTVAEITPRFVTALADGRLLRVGIAGVRPLNVAGPLTGFILLLDDITEDHRARADRDARAAALAETMRASLASVRTALDLLDYPDLDQADRARFEAIVRDTVAEMGDRLAEETPDNGDNPWPLHDMRAEDLIAVAARRINAAVGADVACAFDAGIWLRVDSFAMASALAFLAARYGVNAPALSARRAGDWAHLDLSWRGASTHPAVGWQVEPVRTGDGVLPFTVRDVAERHGGEVWSVPAQEQERPFIRFLLPLAEGRPQAPAGPSASRPVYYDFDLFKAGAAHRALDDRPLTDISYTVFDTETTGLNPADGDEIIQIGATRIVNGRLLKAETFDQLVDPGRSIPELSIPIHGITPEMVRGKPRIGEVLPAFRAFAAGTVLVGHNVAFDMRFLQMKEAQTGIRFDQPVLDTLLLASVLYPHEAGHGLEAMAARLGIATSARHSALGDAMATAAIFLKLIPLLASNGIVTFAEARKASEASPYARLRY